jgi:hypothetical protein
MKEDDQDDGKDEELGRWLRLWEPPPLPARLGERLKASYRSGERRASVWKRLLEARVSMPVPVAVLIVGALLAIGILAGKRFQVSRDHGAGRPSAVEGEGGLANLRPLPEIRLTVLRQGGESDDRH